MEMQLASAALPERRALSATGIPMLLERFRECKCAANREQKGVKREERELLASARRK